LAAQFTVEQTYQKPMENPSEQADKKMSLLALSDLTRPADDVWS
jgi:hypothetical protein